MSSRPPRPATLALHAPKRARTIGAPVAPAIISSNSFHSEFGGVGFSGAGMTKDTPAFYARWGGPTVTLLEQRLAALEGAQACVCFGSGMAAIAGLFLTQLKAGDHLVLSDVCYAGVAELARDLAERHAITISAVDTSDAEAVASAFTPRTRLVHVETPANPTWRLADIARLGEVAHRRGAKLSVDSTVATPIATRPLALGADYVVHSLSKYLVGHGDALGGAVAGGDDDIFALRKQALVHHGGVLNAHAAWLILRGLETLAARMPIHESNARRICAFLEGHSRVKRVYWPGSPSHPQHELAKRQMSNFSGMLSFCADDADALADTLSARLRLFTYTVSLGHTKSLLFYVPTEELLASSFVWSAQSNDAYRRWIGAGAFRVSVGLEDVEDLIADLEQALQ